MKARNDADLLILGSQLQRGEDAQKAREQFILNEQNNMALKPDESVLKKPKVPSENTAT